LTKRKKAEEYLLPSLTMYRMRRVFTLLAAYLDAKNCIRRRRVAGLMAANLECEIGDTEEGSTEGSEKLELLHKKRTVEFTMIIDGNG
jgi:hypothetical protein